MNAIDLEIPSDFDPDDDGEVQVYAELSKKQFNQILDGEVTMEIPYGTSLKHKAGSRALNFICVGVRQAKELEEGLDNSSIAWQESYSGAKYEKIISRNRRHT